jgi:type IV secretory pathway TrbF-like protein
MSATEQCNPYVAARHEWDERYGGLLSRVKQWRIVALVSLANALVSSAGLVGVSAKQGNVPPFIAVIDGQGNTLSSGYVQRTTITDGLKRNSLYNWVKNLRLVTTDMIAQRKAFTAVYDQIASGTAAQEFISEFYRGASPFDRAKTETVDVEVSAALPTSERTYEVDWTETTRDLQGAVKSKEHWKGSFQIVINPPKDEVEARTNPIGLYVTSANWSKVL